MTRSGLARRAATLANWILPKGVADWIRAKRQPSRSLWKGIYDSFDAVPCHGPGYEGDEWLLPRAASTAALKKRLDDAPGQTYPIESRYLLLPACIAGLRASSTNLRILDFGGALGIAYLHLRTAASPLDDCEYYVVDNLRSCEEGRRIFAGDPRIHFRTDAADVPSADVIFMSGVLQYVPNYAEVLHDLTQRFAPKLLLLTLLPVGHFETFASAQINLPGSSMPAWFFGREELEALLSGLGYCLVFRGRAELEFDMDEFPPSHRLDAMSNLVFARTRIAPRSTEDADD